MDLFVCDVTGERSASNSRWVLEDIDVVAALLWDKSRPKKGGKLTI